MYAVYDSQTKVFTMPNSAPTDGAAKRAFCDHVMRDEKVSMWPEDYILYCLGVYDDNTGEFHSQVNPIMKGIEAVAENRNKQEEADRVQIAKELREEHHRKSIIKELEKGNEK